MKLAVVTHTHRLVGGVETYLDRLLPELSARGVELALWSEAGVATGRRETIALAGDAPHWSATALGTDAALRALADWRPDLLFVHGLESPQIERALLGVARAVFFAHTYHGTCISEAKTTRLPAIRTCERRFGVACLGHYYPRRCGGWSPVTLLVAYRRQAARLRLLRSYAALAVASEHMAAEYRRHGLGDRVELLPLPAALAAPVDPVPRDPGRGETAARLPWRLLFLGRMDPLKGGAFLLDALPLAADALGRRLRLVCAGDGPARTDWERRAARLREQRNDLEIGFPGWVEAVQRAELFTASDLLVVPSVWPEPFGMVGVEAGSFGLPAAAFAVGGIPDWLEEGVNGALAPSDPPSAEALAAAIVRCLENSERHRYLAQKARRRSALYGLEGHVDRLLGLLHRVRRTAGTSTAAGRQAGDNR